MKKKTGIIVAIVVLIIVVLGILGYIYVKPYFILKKFQDKIFDIQNEESNYKVEMTYRYKEDEAKVVHYHKDTIDVKDYEQFKLWSDGEKGYYLNLIDRNKMEIDIKSFYRPFAILQVLSPAEEITVLNLVKAIPDFKVTREEFNSIKCYKMYMGKDGNATQYEYIYVNAETFEPVAGIQKSIANNVEKTTTDLFEISYNTVTDEDVKLDF